MNAIDDLEVHTIIIIMCELGMIIIVEGSVCDDTHSSKFWDYALAQKMGNVHMNLDETGVKLFEIEFHELPVNTKWEKKEGTSTCWTYFEELALFVEFKHDKYRCANNHEISHRSYVTVA